MTKLELIKAAVSGIVGIGTSKIVHGIIANNVDTDKTLDKVTVTAGSIVIGSMAADATKKHTDSMIDELVDAIKKIKNPDTDN